MLDFKLAADTALTEFLQVNQKCECGENHALSLKYLYAFNGAMDNLNAVADKLCPIGKAAVIYVEDLEYLFEEVKERLGENRKITALRLPIGYKKTYNDNALNLDEDVRLVVSIGSGAVTNAAKIAAKNLNAPLIAIVSAPSFTDMMSDYAEEWHGFLLKRIKAKAPDAIIADYSIISDAPKTLIAESYGLIISEMLAIFDAFVAEKFVKDKNCPYLADMMVKAVDLAISGGEEIADGINGGYGKLTESALRMSAAKALYGKTFISGVDETLQAYYLLKKNQGITLAEYGLLKFQMFFKLTALYKLFYSAKLNYGTLPPDMDYRFDLLTDKLGLPEELAYRLTNHMISPKEDVYIREKTEETRDYFLSGIEEIIEKTLRSAEVFKKIYGFSEIDDLFDKEEALTAITLAPEIGSKFTTLNIMKYYGIFEK